MTVPLGNPGERREFQRIDAHALARREADAPLIFTSNRQLPPGEPGTIGRLVEALHDLLCEPPMTRGSLFLKRSPSS